MGLICDITHKVQLSTAKIRTLGYSILTRLCWRKIVAKPLKLVKLSVIYKRIKYFQNRMLFLSTLIQGSTIFLQVNMSHFSWTYPTFTLYEYAINVGITNTPWLFTQLKCKCEQLLKDVLLGWIESNVKLLFEESCCSHNSY